MQRTLPERLKRLQNFLGVEPDGVLGAQTLSALEQRLLPSDSIGQATELVADSSATVSPVSRDAGTQVGTPVLTLTPAGIQFIIEHEIGSEAYYQSALNRPTWPGGDSGVTIGIGYDLGYVSQAQFRQDWEALLGTANTERLATVCGSKGSRAKRLVRRFSTIRIPLSAARQVFTRTSLPAYARKTRAAFPGVEQLKPSAQAALLSLVYNRGASMQGASRVEMAAIRDLVPRRDYPEIARQITLMKRLWVGRGLDGLLNRRDAEARLVLQAPGRYRDDELVCVA